MLYHREIGLHKHHCQRKHTRSLQRHEKIPLAADLDNGETKKNEAELGMAEGNVTRLSEEGVEMIEDLVEFASEHLKTIIGHLRCPGRRVSDKANPRRSVPTSSFKFGSKAALRLQNDIDTIKCYENLDFNTISGTLARNPTIKNFKMQCDTLVERNSLVVTIPRALNNLDIDK